ncbi:MAG: pseudouridine synthase [Spirochaetes bacterium]|nr:pseudouridine synthase [Spirochaetota bacterium]
MTPSIEREFPESSVRLQVALARSGIASRRACEEIIRSGRVSVNGRVVTELGTRVLHEDVVEVDGLAIGATERLRYVALNKPVGYLCTMHDEKGRPVAIDLLRARFKERLYNVGRLDFASSGLILFTNDGEFAGRVGHPSGGIDKEYLVDTHEDIPRSFPGDFVRGIDSDGDTLRAERVEILEPRRMSVVLLEGRNREIRRALETVGLRARKLVRIRIGPIGLGGMRDGDFCELADDEVEAILSYRYNTVPGTR